MGPLAANSVLHLELCSLRGRLERGSNCTRLMMPIICMCSLGRRLCRTVAVVRTLSAGILLVYVSIILGLVLLLESVYLNTLTLWA